MPRAGGKRWDILQRPESYGGEAKGWSPRRRYEQRARSWERWEAVHRARFGAEGWEVRKRIVACGLMAGDGYRTLAKETGLSIHMVASLARQFADDPASWGEPEPTWREILARLREMLARLEEGP